MTEKVSERDREYMRRIGRWKAESRAEDLRAHLALPARERLARSEELARSSNGWARPAKIPNEPRSLIERAKKLGFYRS